MQGVRNSLRVVRILRCDKRIENGPDVVFSAGLRKLR